MYDAMIAALKAECATSHDRSAPECIDEIEQPARMTVDTVELEREHASELPQLM